MSEVTSEWLLSFPTDSKNELKPRINYSTTNELIKNIRSQKIFCETYVQAEIQLKLLSYQKTNSNEDNTNDNTKSEFFNITLIWNPRYEKEHSNLLISSDDISSENNEFDIRENHFYHFELIKMFPSIYGIRGPVAIFFKKAIINIEDNKKSTIINHFKKDFKYCSIPDWFQIKNKPFSFLQEISTDISIMNNTFQIENKKKGLKDDRTSFEAEIELSKKISFISKGEWKIHKCNSINDMIAYCDNCCGYDFDELLDKGNYVLNNKILNTRIRNFFDVEISKDKDRKKDNEKDRERENFYWIGPKIKHIFIEKQRVENMEDLTVDCINSSVPIYWNEKFAYLKDMYLVLDFDHLPKNIRFVRKSLTLKDNEIKNMKSFVTKENIMDGDNKEESSWGILDNSSYFNNKVNSVREKYQQHYQEMEKEVYVMDIIQKNIISILIFCNLITEEQGSYIICESFNTPKESKFHLRYPNLILTPDSLRIIRDLILYFLNKYYPFVQWGNNGKNYKPDINNNNNNNNNINKTVGGDILDHRIDNGLRMVFSDKYEREIEKPAGRQNRPIGCFDYQNNSQLDYLDCKKNIKKMLKLTRMNFKNYREQFDVLSPIDFQNLLIKLEEIDEDFVPDEFNNLYRKTFQRIEEFKKALQTVSSIEGTEYFTNKKLIFTDKTISGPLVDQIVKQVVNVCKTNYIETDWEPLKRDSEYFIRLIFANSAKEKINNKKEEKGSETSQLSLDNFIDTKNSPFYMYQGKKIEIDNKERIVSIHIDTNCKYCQRLYEIERDYPAIQKIRMDEKKYKDTCYRMGVHSSNHLYIKVSSKAIHFCCRSENAFSIQNRSKEKIDTSKKKEKKDTSKKEEENNNKNVKIQNEQFIQPCKNFSGNFIANTSLDIKKMIFEELQHLVIEENTRRENELINKN